MTGSSATWLRLVFIGHGLISLAAGVVLIAAPGAIPATVGLVLDERASLLTGFLGAAQLALGGLSLGAARSDDRGMRTAACTFVLWHGTTALVELLWLWRFGAQAVLLVNLLARGGAVVVFICVLKALASRSPPEALR